MRLLADAVGECDALATERDALLVNEALKDRCVWLTRADAVCVTVAEHRVEEIDSEIVDVRRVEEWSLDADGDCDLEESAV